MKTIRNTSSGMSNSNKWRSGLRSRISTPLIVAGIAILLFVIGEQKSFSQGVGISEVSIIPDASAILELRSTLRGLLAPRMTTAQRDAILTPATGLIIYNTSTNNFNYYNGSIWIAILNTGTGVTSINGTLNRISIGGTPTLPIIDIDANYTGQASINTLGTITNGTWNSTRIGLAYGGTNTDLSGGAAIGDILYANTGTSFARLASVVTGNALISGGVGTAPSWGKIGLTTHVNGTLPIANGGTGSATQNFMDLTTAQTIGGAKTFTGAISASNLSGSNTGDQTIALTGDVTGSGTGTFATTIANNAVTYGKMQVVGATSRLLGSSSTTTNVQEISLGSGLSLAGTTLTSTGSGGTVTNFSAGDLAPLFTTTETNTTTTPALSFSFTNAGAYSVFGNNTGVAAAPAYFTPVLASALFQNQGTTTGVLHGNAAGNPSWGQIVNGDITNATIDLTTKVTGILASINGGTGNGFTKFAGPTTSEKTFTLPDASVTILTSNSPVTVSQGGTGLTAGTQGGIPYFNSTTTMASSALLTQYGVMIGGGAGSSPSTIGVGATNTLLHGNTGGAPTFSAVNLATDVTGTLSVANGGTGSTTPNYWTLTGNTGTNETSDFVGTIDNHDLVFRANNTERARIVSATGDIKIGDANTGTLRSSKELVLQEDGDQYGTSILRLRNRTAENGAIFENPHATITLVDFIFRTSANQRNIRYEARAAYARSGVPSFHIGGPTPDVPTLSIGDNYAAFNAGVRIGYYAGAVIPVPAPTALLHISAGTTTAGTAPLKFTSSGAGNVLSTPEDGAVEYDGTNYFVTTGTTRYTLAKTLTATASLTFGSTPSMTSTEQTISVPGAADGDVVIVGVPSASSMANSTFTARVSSTNTVSVKFNNYSAGALTPGVGTFRVSVFKY